MRSVFLISAIVLHVSWCYAIPAYPGGSWMPGFFNPFGNYGMPSFVNRFNTQDKETIPNKINGLSDQESKPGVSGVHGSSGPSGVQGSSGPSGVQGASGPSGGFYSISHSSFVTTVGKDGKVHKDRETVVNDNGKITKFKY